MFCPGFQLKLEDVHVDEEEKIDDVELLTEVKFVILELFFDKCCCQFFLGHVALLCKIEIGSRCL